MLDVFDTGKQSAKANMLFDQKSLETLDPEGDPLFHFYEWLMPSITYGYFVDPSHSLRMDQVQAEGIDLARRPTGGGIVFHLWDFAFSFLMPSRHPACSLNVLENYLFVNEVVLEAVKDWIKESPSAELTPEDFPLASQGCRFFCMARPTQYDVVYQGRKLAGAAQRRTRRGYLHQGTLSLMAPPPETLSLLLSEKEVQEAMQSYSFPLLGSNPSLSFRESFGVEMKKRLTDRMIRKLQIYKDNNHGQENTRNLPHA